LEKDSIILGIDPGTNVMGYGLIAVNKKVPVLIVAGVLQLESYEGQAEKLRHIFIKTLALIDEYKPEDLAIEAPFFGKNVQSMLKLGRAQGVALAAALHRSVTVTEYSPKKIKMSVTGNGNASKEQVAAMLQRLLGFTDMPKYLDATDGLAAAVCHHFQNGAAPGVQGKKLTGWKAFLSENPERRAG
jgi:crossover junction endodeoxyribonuclease RuvC